MDDSLQPTIDMLLNLSIFIWYGAICPWVSFRVNNVIPTYRLVFLGILILLLRRLPVVLAMHKKITEIEHFQQAAFVGFFGPIGVSAIFYLYVSIDFLNQVTVDGTTDGQVREDAARLQEVMRVVIWFMAICSIVVHGLSVPLGKLGYHLPQSMSAALSASLERDNSDIPFSLGPRLGQYVSRGGIRKRPKRNPEEQPPNAIFRVGGSIVRSWPPTTDTTSDDEPHRPIKFISGPNSRAETPAPGSPAKESNLSPDNHRARKNRTAEGNQRQIGSRSNDGGPAIQSTGCGPGLSQLSRGTDIEAKDR